MNKNIPILLIAIGFLIGGLFLIKNKMKVDFGEKIVIEEEKEIKNTERIFEPVNGFKTRIIKKPFGIFVTPKNSPIQPEKFIGYHTGVDVEFADEEGEIEIRSICAGEVVLKRWVSGYGGTVVIKCQKNGVDYYLLYGHLKSDSITIKNKIENGEKLGILGEGGTVETDYERKHLHFSIRINSMDLRGYVQNQNELNNWINPEKQNLFVGLE